MGNIILSEDLIELGINSASKADAIKILADKLKAMGFVYDGYYENVMKREESFPTGLPTIIPIALCHTEAQYVKQSALSVGTLKSPIEFNEMGTPENLLKVNIIFLMALNDPKDQIAWLQKMVIAFKSKETLEHIQFADDKKELKEYLEKLFDSSST
jgi:PTS system galactitol-specific IIA component